MTLAKIGLACSMGAIVLALLSGCGLVIWKFLQLEDELTKTALQLKVTIVDLDSQSASATPEVKKTLTAVIKLLDISTATVKTVPGIANSQLTETRKELNTQLIGINSNLQAQVAYGLTMIDQHATEINKQLTTANATLASVVPPINKFVADANPRVMAILDNAKDIESQVNIALPDFLDCYADGSGNANCLYNRYVGTSKALITETEAVSSIAVDFHEELFGKKKSLRRKILDSLHVFHK